MWMIFLGTFASGSCQITNKNKFDENLLQSSASRFLTAKKKTLKNRTFQPPAPGWLPDPTDLRTWGVPQILQMETTLPGNLKRGKELQFLAGWRGCGPDLLPPAPGNFPVQPLQPPAPSSQLTSHYGCFWFYLSIYFGRASELFEIPRYHRWRKIGVALLAARNTSPTTAIGSKTWNCIVIADVRFKL